MEIRHLQHFVAVAEERQFTRAARRVNIVQSGLSASIRTLEQELGIPLLVRTTRQLELTEAGRAFLIEARRVLVAVQGARDAVAARGAMRGTITIGTMQRLAPLFALSSVLARFRSAHPEVEIRLHQGSSGGMLAEVRDGRLDFALVALVGQPPAGIATTPLAESPVVFACSRSHPLATRDHVSLTTVAGESFVDFEPGFGIRVLNDRAFATAHLDRRMAFEVNDVSTFMDLVEHGLGVSLVPHFLVTAEPGVRWIPVVPALPIWRLVVARPGRRRMSTAAAALHNLFLPRPPIRDDAAHP